MMVCDSIMFTPSSWGPALSNMWLPGATSNPASDSWILDTTDTVDGSEIQQSQVEVGVSFFPLSTRF